jgi:uncharacterized protein (UPF0262 family)
MTSRDEIIGHARAHFGSLEEKAGRPVQVDDGPYRTVLAYVIGLFAFCRMV